MADHSTTRQGPDGRAVPDYDLADDLHLRAEQTKLMLHPTRRRIIDLLSERAATTSQLADVLEQPKGTIGHHCKALEAGGLITVVRTARVRAIEERYYGRTARLFIMDDLEGLGVSFGHVLDETFAELQQAALQRSGPDDRLASGDGIGDHLATARYARIPADRASEWAGRLAALADEFAAQERGGEQVYGVLLGLFVTDRRGFG